MQKLVSVCMLSHFSCVQLFSTLYCSLPGSSVHGILQARRLEWVAMPFSRRPSRTRDQTYVSYVSYIGRWVLSHIVKMVKNCHLHVGDLGPIPGLGRSPVGGHGNPLQSSCLENPTDRGARQATIHGVAKSRTGLSN